MPTANPGGRDAEEAQERDGGEDGGEAASHRASSYRFYDYDVARHLLEKPLARSIGGGISDSARRIYEQLVSTFEQGTVFTVPQLVSAGTYSDQALRGFLYELREANLVEVVEPNRGPKPAQYMLSGQVLEEAAPLILPAPEEIEG